MSSEKFAVVVLGAGIAGLSAAYKLEQEGYDYCLFEAEERAGGLCRSHHVDGYTFDYTGHLLHFACAEIEEFVRDLVGGALRSHNRRAWIYSNGTYTRYPFQRNLFGLPENVVKECVLDYLEASMGTPEKHREDFQSWAIASFGKGIANHFMVPYNRKLWTVEPDKLTCGWLGRRVPDTRPIEIIKGAFSYGTEETGYNVQFFYPQRGGIEVVPNAIASRLSRVRLGKKAVRVDLRGKLISFEDGSSCRFKSLISTIPLPELVASLAPLPGSVRRAGQRLIHNSVLDVNIGFNVSELSDKHWVYVPEPEIPFYRIGFLHNFSSSLVPEGKTSAYVEVAYRDGHSWGEERLIKEVLSGMDKMGFGVSKSDVDVVNILDMKYAYVIYDFHREKSLSLIKKFLDARGIITAGRFGSWGYLSMEDSIAEGFAAAHRILS